MPKKAIIEGSRNREKVVREKIIEYKEISHNKLLRIIVNDEKLMAKTTFAKIIKILLEKELISSRKEKNKVFYSSVKKTHLKQLDWLERYYQKLEKMPRRSILKLRLEKAQNNTEVALEKRLSSFPWWKKLSVKEQKAMRKEWWDERLPIKVEEVRADFSLFVSNIAYNNLMFTLDEISREEFDKAEKLQRKILKRNLAIWGEDNDADYLLARIEEFLKDLILATHGKDFDIEANIEEYYPFVSKEDSDIMTNLPDGTLKEYD